MYLRIINDLPVWPYTPNMLRMDEPGTSFPDVITDEMLAQYQVFLVKIDSKPSITYQQDAVRVDPVYENDEWVQHWEIVNVDNETAQERYNAKCAEVRETRNGLLRDCDWTQLSDVPESISSVWRSYRQELRDITADPNFPFDLSWPASPT